MSQTYSLYFLSVRPRVSQTYSLYFLSVRPRVSQTYSLYFLSVRPGVSQTYSLYFLSVRRGKMFIDCSSWKSSLHAYGIFNDDTCVDDLQ